MPKPGQSIPPSLAEGLVRHRQAILRYTQGIVRDPNAAEDLTQETLQRACDKLADLDDPARPLPWLYRIATNLCRDRFRSAAFRHTPQSLDSGTADIDGSKVYPEPVDDTPRLEKLFEQKEMSACVQTYLCELPDSYRAAILLHDVEGMTNPEIAKMLDLSVATVKIRVHRARRKLRKALDDACKFSVDDRGVLVCDKKPGRR